MKKKTDEKRQRTGVWYRPDYDWEAEAGRIVIPSDYLDSCPDFLPVSHGEMEQRGWDRPDFVYITGDAYVDHPSFGPAILSRLLESQGYRVAMLPQPDWRDPASVTEFGRPRLGFLISAGNMDSMVNHYAVSKKRRSRDAYTPGGVMGKRPDYACTVYSRLVRQAYGDVPVIIGGIEASLRRMAHYDYWSDRLKPSVLLDAQADLLCYGMGERATLQIADALNSGIDVKDITFVRGTVFRTEDPDQISTIREAVLLPPFGELKKDKKKYAASFYIQYQNTDSFSGKVLAEPYDEQGWVIQNPPSRPLSQEEMDGIYDMPYRRRWHPSYDQAGGIPAFDEVKFSLVSSRGCFGGCSFCALTFHQGRVIQSRSHASLLREAVLLTKDPDFKGYIHDVGGPTADFRFPACGKQLTEGVCRNRQCLFPSPCRNLKADHQDYISLLRKLRSLPGVKKVFIRSGIRFDYVMADRNTDFLEELCRYHVSGQLKVAPEHVAGPVLRRMGKPEHQVYEEFVRAYTGVNRKLGLKQYLVPYLMSSHPGSTMKEAVALAEYVRDIHFTPQQVQDFYPTPSTLSTCMYYTGLDPRDMKPVYVPVSPHEKAVQRALIQYRMPGNRELVREGLRAAGREDLIGYGPECLVRPEAGAGAPPPRDGQRRSGEGKPESRPRKRKTIRNIHKKKDQAKKKG